MANAQMASVKTKFSSYKEELEINVFNDNGIYASGNNVKDYVTNIKDEDIDKFVIIKSKLLYIGSNELEANVAESLGLGGGNSASAVKEIQAIVSGVIELNDNPDNVLLTNSELELAVKEDGTNNIFFNDSTANGFIGYRLCKRNSTTIGNKNWNIVDEYTTSNKKEKRYDNGYYYLKSGDEYIIDGEKIKFSNSYIIDYSKKEFTILSDRAVNWNFYEAIPFSENLIFSFDPSNLVDGEWKTSTGETGAMEFYDKNGEPTGLYKKGDVEWNSATKTLDFNKTHADEPKDMDGYLYTYGDSSKSLANGFTMIIIGDLKVPTKESNSGYVGFGLAYFKHGKGYNTWRSGRFLCSCLDTDTVYLGDFADTGNTSKTYFDNKKGYYSGASDISLNSDFFSNWNGQNFQFAAVLDRQTKVKGDNDKEGDVYSKYSFYSDGNCIANLGYKDSDYDTGLTYWDSLNTEWDFGRCPHGAGAGFEYLCGSFYSILLYDKPLSDSDVKKVTDNVNKYVDSFIKNKDD